MADLMKAPGDILKKVLEISDRQAGLLAENRLEELLMSQSERERLINILKSALGTEKGGEGLKAIIAEINRNDAVLCLTIESRLHELKEKIEKVRNGKKAFKAYAAGEARMSAR